MKKLLLFVFGVLVLLPIVFILLLKLPVFGAHPSGSDRERFAQSSAFNSTEGVFQNRRPDLIENMRENNSTIELMREWFRKRDDASPTAPLPERQPDIDEFLATGNDTRVIWFGHSTFLLNLGGTIVLVDPVFSRTAAPLNFTARRFQPPVLSLEQLPNIDIILISHDHYDHLDAKTISFFADSDVRFITPLGVGLHLRRWGVDAERITERDWWSSFSTDGVEFTATPAQHFSGRDGINNNETLWASWVLTTVNARLFFSGDSGYDTHFKEIGERFGPFDVAFLENGQYDESWQAVHLMPRETIQAFKDLKSRHLFPVHWGMFELAFHTWYDPIVQLSALAEAEQISLVTPVLGQTVSINDTLQTPRWWQPLL